ncbi:MAG: hypothetical protein PHV06_05020 [bacterium]|nr:hypothetical protein [bacterium]
MGKFEKYKNQDGQSKLDKYKKSHGQTLKEAEESSISNIKEKTKPLSVRKKEAASADQGSAAGNIVIAVLGILTVVVWIGVLMKLL